MPKPKSTHRNLPPRMTLRTYRNKAGDVWIGYYYEHKRDAAGKRKATPLGPDLAEAKKKWAEIEGKEAPTDPTTIAGVYLAYMAWANNRTESTLSVRTLSDRAKYWLKLEPVYGPTPINAILPEHILPYFHARSSKSSGKKELKFLSVMFNWARGRGLMRVPNPCAGLFAQMKVAEGRNIYVEDEWLALVYASGSDLIKDALDLAYLTGQRPADVKKMRWDWIKDGALIIGGAPRPGQRKTGARLRIVVEGELKALLERIKARGIKGLTVLTDPKGQPLNDFGHFRNQFKKARDVAQKVAEESGVEFVRFQFRDLRPKAASDIDSLHSIKSAQKLLGHTTEGMTAEYIRQRRGDVVHPMERKRKDG